MSIFMHIRCIISNLIYFKLMVDFQSMSKHAYLSVFFRLIFEFSLSLSQPPSCPWACPSSSLIYIHNGYKHYCHYKFNTFLSHWNSHLKLFNSLPFDLLTFSLHSSICRIMNKSLFEKLIFRQWFEWDDRMCS